MTGWVWIPVWPETNPCAAGGVGGRGGNCRWLGCAKVDPRLRPADVSWSPRQFDPGVCPCKRRLPQWVPHGVETDVLHHLGFRNGNVDAVQETNREVTS